MQTSSIGELEEEGGPGKGEAQRRLHWLQVSVSVVCLSFRRRYFYNKIRNYEALELPSRTKIPLFNSGKILMIEGQ